LSSNLQNHHAKEYAAVSKAKELKEKKQTENTGKTKTSNSTSDHQANTAISE